MDSNRVEGWTGGWIYRLKMDNKWMDVELVQRIDKLMNAPMDVWLDEQMGRLMEKIKLEKRERNITYVRQKEDGWTHG